MAEIIKPEVKRIIPTAGYFEISKINKEGRQIKYRLLNKLSKPMNQFETTEYYEKAKKAGNPLPLSSIGVMNLLEDSVHSGNSELQSYIYSSLKNNWIGTTSIVEYNPENQKDETFHNWKTSDEYSLIGNIVGDDDPITDMNNKEALEFLVKTKDINKLNKISKSVNKTPMYIWRFNSKPDEKTQSRVWFDAYSDMLILNAYRSLSNENPAFLVEQVE
jgi:hypothetical protein